MPVGDFNPAPKPGKTVRVKPTQRQLGEISAKVDKQLKDRSGYVCELCKRARAVERAHIIGRKQLKQKTTVDLLLRLCMNCHDWLDETPEGIKYRKSLADRRNSGESEDVEQQTISPASAKIRHSAGSKKGANKR